MSELYSTGQASKMLGVADYRLHYLLKTGKIKEPSKFNNQRYFTQDDIDTAKKIIEDIDNQREERRDQLSKTQKRPKGK